MVGFHISIPMDYLESSTFFCADKETVKDMVKNTMASSKMATAHPLEKLA